MRVSNENIYNALNDVITEEGIEWASIVAHIRTLMKIKNWMKVRGVIQYMINTGIIKRTDDAYKEVYFRV